MSNKVEVKGCGESMNWTDLKKQYGNDNAVVCDSLDSARELAREIITEGDKQGIDMWLVHPHIDGEEGIVSTNRARGIIDQYDRIDTVNICFESIGSDVVLWIETFDRVESSGDVCVEIVSYFDFGGR